jgi:negative regulator of flagellin synthesis FlgM
MTGTPRTITGAARVLPLGVHDPSRTMSSTPSHKPEHAEHGVTGATPPPAEQRDTVAMSELGASLARIQEAAAAAADVRADRVADLKARIRAGDYRVDADALAERMLDFPGTP